MSRALVLVALWGCSSHPSAMDAGSGGGTANGGGGGGGGSALGGGAAAGGGAGAGGGHATGGGVGLGGGTGGAAGGEGGGARDAGHLFEPCATDFDCSDGLCRPTVVGGIKRCTRHCSQPSDCATGTVCRTNGLEIVCMGNDTGRPCTEPADCNAFCLGSPGYCTVPCGTGADCPNGYGCTAVGGQSICVRAEASCAAADTGACLSAAACDTSSALVASGCTLACVNSSDCPQRAESLPAWTCNGSGLCQRPPDVYGPLPTGTTPAQYACNATSVVVTVCNDGQHIDLDTLAVPAPPTVSCASTTTTGGAANDSCVDSCRYQGGCPFGFACAAVGMTATERSGLCLPTGTGEIGAVCTRAADCAFGYCNAGTCSRDCTGDGVCTGTSVCADAGTGTVEGQPFRLCQ